MRGRPVYFVRSAEHEPGYRRRRDEGIRVAETAVMVAKAAGMKVIVTKAAGMTAIGANGKTGAATATAGTGGEGVQALRTPAPVAFPWFACRVIFCDR
jgi:hypothetical protein